MSDVLIARRGRTARITLNRPAALNALTAAMVGEIGAALGAFAVDNTVALVLIDAAGGRAFCAGGDIVGLYRGGRSNPAAARSFWREEYRLNAAIARFAKPVVTLMDGIVMGGGVGLGCHAAHRVVTERSLVAMPEVSIGFSPDVGGTRLLGLAPGHLGDYLAATGARMNAADAIFAGFADRLVRSERLPALVAALEADADPASLAAFTEVPAPSPLQAHLAEIDSLFADFDTAMPWASDETSAFAQATAVAVRRNAPFSVLAALHAVREARRDPAIEACLRREYRFSFRVVDHDDFYAGIRAAVIDKDYNPRWRPARLAEVDLSAVEAAFAPLGAEEWTA